MTQEELLKKVRLWDQETDPNTPQATSHYGTILNQLQYHAKHEWRTYVPALNTEFNPNYMDRLASWIGNLSDETDQKLLLEYALQISFFSHEDFISLYRTAFNREVIRWVTEQIGAKFESNSINEFQDKITKQIQERTWFCPITDSMDINEFYKVNNLSGIAHRPAFATLQMLAEHPDNPNKETISNLINQFMTNPNSRPQKYSSPPLERIILLEDIVGSGSQCLKAIKWAVSKLKKPILFIPLILCPNGEEALKSIEQISGNIFSVRPVIKLRRGDLLGPERKDEQGWEKSKFIEDLASRYSNRASSGKETFGYKNTGCSIATFSNTPDNTLPIVHNKSQTGGQWEPLFPRVYRE